MQTGDPCICGCAAPHDDSPGNRLIWGHASLACAAFPNVVVHSLKKSGASSFIYKIWRQAMQRLPGEALVCWVAFLKFIVSNNHWPPEPAPHSTVTLFAKFRGLSTSVPRAHAV
jgi:hypothetical protein